MIMQAEARTTFHTTTIHLLTLLRNKVTTLLDNPIHKNTGIGYAILHFYLYSSLHIAICAMAITAYTYFILPLRIVDHSYVAFVGAATLLLYSLHRIIGIKKSSSYANQGRFAIIVRYKSHLIFYSIASSLYCIHAYVNFDWNRKLLLFIPAVLSLGYSLPIFWGGKRLRDFHWIKIFLIAICWAVITCTIPYCESMLTLCDSPLNCSALILLTIERAIFIFAITIPFDIRDREVDKSTEVNTLATRYSDITLVKIARVALLSTSIVACILYLLGTYSELTLPPLLITYLITAYLIRLSNERRSDYFYTGIMDGTMLLPTIIISLYVILLSIF